VVNDGVVDSKHVQTLQTPLHLLSKPSQPPPQKNQQQQRQPNQNQQQRQHEQPQQDYPS